MCLQPYAIKNPRYGLKSVGVNYLFDCDSQYINIPCGHCPQCIAIKQMYMVQRVQMEALRNHLFFVTLTYDNKHLPVVSTSTGYDIRYADISHLQLLFKRLRKISPRPFRYLAVSELGTKKGRPHFHFILLVEKLEKDDYYTCMNLEKWFFDNIKECWSENVGTKRKPVYEPRFVYVRKWIGGRLRYNYDCHYVNFRNCEDGVTSVAFYVLKYMLKPSDRAVRLQRALHLNLDEDEYEHTWNLVKPRCVTSKGFGLNGRLVDRKLVTDSDIVKYLHKCVSDTPEDSSYPFYINPDSGLSFPLGKYYRRFSDIWSIQDAHDFYFTHAAAADKDRNDQQAFIKFQKYEEMVKKVREHDMSCDFDFLCE